MKRISKKERDERRRKWELEESRLGELNARLEPTLRASVRKMEVRTLSPAKEAKLAEIRNGRPQPDTNFDQYLINLLRSNYPISIRIRDILADKLERLCFPVRYRQRLKECGDFKLRMEKHHLVEERGMTVKEAEHEIAKRCGLSVYALRKKLQRSPKNSRTKP
jgi:hypothetical protein